MIVVTVFMDCHQRGRTTTATTNGHSDKRCNWLLDCKTMLTRQWIEVLREITSIGVCKITTRIRTTIRHGNNDKKQKMIQRWTKCDQCEKMWWMRIGTKCKKILVPNIARNIPCWAKILWVGTLLFSRISFETEYYCGKKAIYCRTRQKLLLLCYISLVLWQKHLWQGGH